MYDKAASRGSGGRAAVRPAALTAIGSNAGREAIALSGLWVASTDGKSFWIAIAYLTGVESSPPPRAKRVPVAK
jgi:hypothetical protein